jgi:dihydrofolate reductase
MSLTVTYYVAASLDGFIAREDGSLDWLIPYEDDPEVAADFPAFEQSIDSLVMGRKTYEFLLSLDIWPHAGKVGWILSSKAHKPLAPDMTISRLTPVQVIEAANARGCRHLWLAGGGAIAGAFQQAGLITDYRITYVPVLLGYGVPLFGLGAAPTPLKTVNVKNFSCGLTQIHSQRVLKKESEKGVS